MPLATTRREAGFAQQVIPALMPHFNIHTEVHGTHPTGRRLRIDAVAVPRSPDGWSRSDIALGIEFKAPSEREDQRRERKGNAKIICQCIDYTLTDWDGFGYLPIFFCPGFAESRAVESRAFDFFADPKDYNEGFRHGIGFMMQAILGQSNAGELIHSDHLGWAFVINGHHRIWTEKYGIGEGSRNKLLRSIGSR
jgi:hypothetical protein